MSEKHSRKRHKSHPTSGGFTTSSPVFYTIPWTGTTDYSVSGLGPGQSNAMMPYHPYPSSYPALSDGYGGYPAGGFSRHNHDGPNFDYSKAGFTYFKRGEECICGFLSEYKKQFQHRGSGGHSGCAGGGGNRKPWWNGRELTSKFDPKYPCYPMHMQALSTYSKDFTGEGGRAADLCYPEGEIERAMRVLQLDGGRH